MTHFVLRAMIAAAGLWLATVLVGGLSIADPLTLILAALLLGLCNAIVKPILVILTLPATILTLGLFLLVINGAVLALVAWLLPGFAISGFGAAILGALIVSLTGIIGSMLFKGRSISPAS
jgi:putative membrane protein